MEKTVKEFIEKMDNIVGHDYGFYDSDEVLENVISLYKNFKNIISNKISKQELPIGFRF